MALFLPCFFHIMKQLSTNLSIVLSFRNEADVLEALITRLQKTLDPVDKSYEIVFINDASTDASLEILKEKASRDNRLKIINMSRCFGHAECVFAGLKNARGKRVLYMDADLQDPPEIIPEMIHIFDEENADVVYTTRQSRAGETIGKRFITALAYRMVHAVSDVSIPVDSGDFKLLSRRVVDHLVKLRERGLYVKGLVSWLGFKQVPLYYHRDARVSGKSKFPILKSKGPVISFIRAIVSFSKLPVYAILMTGIGLFLLSILLITGGLGVLVFWGSVMPSWGYIILSILFMGSLQIMALGIIGLYVSHVHDNTMARPRYIIESSINLNENT